MRGNWVPHMKRSRTIVRGEARDEKNLAGGAVRKEKQCADSVFSRGGGGGQEREGGGYLKRMSLAEGCDQGGEGVREKEMVREAERNYESKILSRGFKGGRTRKGGEKRRKGAARRRTPGKALLIGKQRLGRTEGFGVKVGDQAEKGEKIADDGENHWAKRSIERKRRSRRGEKYV